MVFHFGVVEVVKQEGRALLNFDGVVSAVKGCSGLERDLTVELRRGEEVAAYEHELQEDLFELVCMSIDDLVFLESF